jgi:hypothetical protein
LVIAVWNTGWPPADVNADGAVDAQGLAIVLANTTHTAGMDLPGDVNGDRVVDDVDRGLLEAVW